MFGLILLSLTIAVSGGYVDHHIKKEFEKNFHDRCDKYSFVQKYYNMLENDSGRYFIFVHHEKQFKNGGFGDRLGGLVSAAANSIRFNRTLLIQASNGLHQLFQPYHPSIAENSSSFLWQNWANWTRLNEVRQESGDQGTVELDCVSDQPEGFPVDKTRACAMDDGDLSQPIIRFKSNRAYLCHWEKNKNVLAHTQIRQALGITKKTDLFEVAGCLTRLVLWPTDELWRATDEIYNELDRSMSEGRSSKDSIKKPKKKRSKKKSKRKSKKAKRRLMAVSDSDALYTEADSSSNDETVITNANTSYFKHPVFQIGLQFRCGDRWSYTGYYNYGFGGKITDVVKNEGYSEHACVFDVDGENSPEEKSYYMNAGNPYGIGLCGKKLLDKYTTRRIENKVSMDGTMDVGFSREDDEDSSRHTLLYVTSDNVKSSEQMNQTASHPSTLICPQGCHIEMEPTIECFTFTTAHWFILSLSDLIVTQTFTKYNLPTSAFSRFAGIYGLKANSRGNNPFYSGKTCDDEFFSSAYISRMPQGNWFCD